MKLQFKINETLLVGIVAFIALIGFVIWVEPMRDNFRCPNDYQTADKYINGMFEWISGELKNNPKMTKEDLMNKRMNLFLENNCEKSRWTEQIFGESEEDIQIIPPGHPV